MLDVDKVDLSSLAEALEDHSDFTEWFVDPETGEVQPFTPDDDESPTHRLIAVEPIPSSESYRDMEDFIARVRDPRARDLLTRAVQGRGAFRRFKDTLLEFPKLRAAWFAFHDARMERRAVEWLAAHTLIDDDDAERALAARPDPEHAELGVAFDPERIARDVAKDLQELYGDRLRRVILFGSWARGDAHPESDIDLLVVLRDMDSPWDELERMDGVMWRHSYDNDTVVSAHAVTEKDFIDAATPLLRRVQIEGRRVA